MPTNWKSRAVSAADVVSVVRNGMKLFVHGACATPAALIDALCARRDLSGVRIYHLHTAGPAPFAAPGRQGEFRSVSLFTGEITGAEALLRWELPARDILAPHEFLGVAEELDIISDIGRWVLRKACRQVQEWSRSAPDAPPLTIAVNLSARQFTSAELLADVERAIRDFSLMPSSLALEVNERTVSRDVERAAGALTGLRALGVWSAES